MCAKATAPHNRVLAAGQKGEEWRDVAQGGQARPGVVVYRFAASLYYANTAQFSAEVPALAAHSEPPVRELALDFSAVSSIDYSDCQTLLETADALQKKGVLVVLLVAKDTLAALEKGGLIDKIGRGNVYPTLRDYLKTHCNFEALVR